MMTRIATCLLALGFLAGCTSTNTTKRETLREMTARYASNETTPNLKEPAPPAEGPEDNRSLDPTQNPALVPTPLLRSNAAGGP